MTLSQLTNKLQDMCHNGHSLAQAVVRIGKKKRAVERIEIDGKSQTVLLVLNDTNDDFVDIIKKIETLDKTKVYIVTTKDCDYETMGDLCDYLKNNGMKAVVLPENMKMFPANEAKEVIDYVKREFGIKDGDLK